ncbi:MlaD family protein [Fodinicola feengrottensis]|uniref:MlaD family protein n=1 Tax=Fodinicola feengrottensis TaxID=435914 RepID=UPI0013D017C5|nr:MlaD family protein [Fodinicola feengrottensis]
MRLRVGALLAVAAVLLSGCGLSFQNLPIGRGGEGPSYDLTAIFTDAAQLPLGGQVRIGQAVVGRVTSLQARKFQAVVHMRIDVGTQLPVGTTARLELTSVLGEEYVLLVPPDKADRGFLANAAVIGLADTARARGRGEHPGRGRRADVRQRIGSGANHRHRDQPGAGWTRATGAKSARTAGQPAAIAGRASQ